MNRFLVGMLVLVMLVLRPPATGAQPALADASQDSLRVTPGEIVPEAMPAVQSTEMASEEQAPDMASEDNSPATETSGRVSGAAPPADEERGFPPASRSTGGRNARVAMLSSLAFPGLGQLYNDEGWKTIVVFTWEAYYIARILRDGQQADFYRRKADALGEGETWRGLGYSELRRRFNRHIERETDYIWYSGALILASVLDAYVFAHLHDFETDDVRGRRGVVLPLLDQGRRSIGLQFWLHF